MTIADTSRESHGQISMRQRKTQNDEVFDIVVGACRNGAQDMSLREIARAFATVHGRNIDVGTVSARVSALVDAQRLVRLKGSIRACTITGKTVAPVTVPAKQVRLF
jgi:hypothetical protein